MPVSIFLETAEGEPEEWKLYLPQESFALGCPTILKVEALKDYFKRRQIDLKKVRSLCWFNVDVRAILRDERFMQAWEDFETELIENTEFIMACMGLAMHLLIGKIGKDSKLPDDDDDDEPTETDDDYLMKIIIPKLLNHGPAISVGKLHSGLYDKLVTIKGNVISVRTPDIVCTWIAFQCSLCHKQQVVKQAHLGCLVLPTMCSGEFYPCHF